MDTKLTDTKTRILLKAHELFNRYGIRSVSMDDISAQLGMSKKTLYQYYVDKDELVTAVISTLIHENKTECQEDQRKAENPIHEIFISFDRMSQMFSSMNPSVLFDMEKYHPDSYRKFNEFRNGFLYQLIRGNLEKGVSEGLYRPEIDVDILTRYRLYSVMLAFNSTVFPDNRTRLLRIEQELIEHFLYGVATLKGIKLIQKYKEQRTSK